MAAQKTVICHDLQGKAYSIDTSSLRFRPAVYAIIVQDGRILLSPQWGGYDFPGGGVELGEKLNETLTREVREETGYDIEVGHFVNCFESFFKMPGREEFVHSILLYYLGRIIHDNPSPQQLAGNEIGNVGQPEWVELDRTDQIKFATSIDSLALLHEARRMMSALK